VSTAPLVTHAIGKPPAVGRKAHRRVFTELLGAKDQLERDGRENGWPRPLCDQVGRRNHGQHGCRECWLSGRHGGSNQNRVSKRLEDINGETASRLS